MAEDAGRRPITDRGAMLISKPHVGGVAVGSPVARLGPDKQARAHWVLEVRLVCTCVLRAWRVRVECRGRSELNTSNGTRIDVKGCDIGTAVMTHGGCSFHPYDDGLPTKSILSVCMDS